MTYNYGMEINAMNISYCSRSPLLRRLTILRANNICVGR